MTYTSKIINSFDEKLPKTTTYWTEGEIFFIKNTSFFFTQEETLAMVDLFVFAMKEQTTKGVVINNREAGGAWPQEIFEILGNNVEYKNAVQNKKIATLTDNPIKSMQTNRVSRKDGIDETSKTFDSEFNNEVKAFLLG